MRRTLSLLALAFTVALAGACANPAAPTRDGDGDEETERCGVTVGTQTRCADTTSNG